jgi:hypothetical protein
MQKHTNSNMMHVLLEDYPLRMGFLEILLNKSTIHMQIYSFLLYPKVGYYTGVWNFEPWTCRASRRSRSSNRHRYCCMQLCTYTCTFFSFFVLLLSTMRHWSFGILLHALFCNSVISGKPVPDFSGTKVLGTRLFRVYFG